MRSSATCLVTVRKRNSPNHDLALHITPSAVLEDGQLAAVERKFTQIKKTNNFAPSAFICVYLRPTTLLYFLVVYRGFAGGSVQVSFC